jgi:hypothetical protein
MVNIICQGYNLVVMNKNKLLLIAVFAAALLQLVSPGLSNFENPSGDVSTTNSVPQNNQQLTNNVSNSDPMITPAGYAFIVWGVITISAFIYSIYQLLSNRKNRELHIQIAPNLIATYILFAAWLLAAGQNWLVATVIIFVIMFALLANSFGKILAKMQQLTMFEKLFLFGQIAIYTGWATVAVFANTASAIKYYGITDMGTKGIIWQSLILLSALANSVFWVKKFKQNVVYIATIVWAFVGVLMGLLRFKEAIVLQSVTVLAIAVVLFFAFKIDQKLRSIKFSSNGVLA